MSDFKFQKFQIDYKGVGQLLKGKEMQGVLKQAADGVRKNVGGEGYGTDVYIAQTRAISSVYTDDKETFFDNMENNTLLKGL